MSRLNLVFICLAAAISFFLCSCSENTIQEQDNSSFNLDSISFQHSMKGWELYSWQTDNEWNYSILVGTNRSKTQDEVLKNKIIVTGKEALKLLLTKFPEKEEIFWVGKGWAGINWDYSILKLSLPDNQIINEIKAHCILKKLILNINYGS